MSSPTTTTTSAAAASGSSGCMSTVTKYLKTYFSKWPGTGEGALWMPPFPPIGVVIGSWVGSFCGIAIVMGLNSKAAEFTTWDGHTLDFFMASMGASAVLLYSAIKSPLGQPRNVLFGHVISAIVGVACCKLITTKWLSGAVAVAFSVVFMEIFGCTHPPGGATALIAITADKSVQDLGFFFVLTPVLTCIPMMIIVAVIINNINRVYPIFWCLIPPAARPVPAHVSTAITATLPSSSVGVFATDGTKQAAIESKSVAIEMTPPLPPSTLPSDTSVPAPVSSTGAHLPLPTLPASLSAPVSPATMDQHLNAVTALEKALQDATQTQQQEATAATATRAGVKKSMSEEELLQWVDRADVDWLRRALKQCLLVEQRLANDVLHQMIY